MIRITVNLIIRLLVHLMARIKVSGSERIPVSGPLIVVTNHINFFEAPLIYFLLQHLNVRALVKAETWSRPALRILANLWRAIPIKRGGVDRGAFSRALAVLDEGGVVAVAPEGTRSHHGKLQRASAGVVVIAARSGAPVLPIAHWGGEKVLASLRRFRRAAVRVRVGLPVIIRPEAADARQSRDRELEFVMKKLAALLPPEYRGYYA